MKIINILFFILLLVVAHVGYSQDDVVNSMNSAKDFYASGKLQDARFSLQQTLQALDVVIGREILKILPKDINQFTCDEKQDNVMGSSGGLTGLNVSKYYFDKTDSSKSLNISLINNSPLMASLNAFMTNPMFMNSANGNQKVVRVAGYKAMLNKRMNENVITGYELQLPFGQSLMTFTCEGVTKEPDMIALAEKVDIKSVIALAGGN